MDKKKFAINILSWVKKNTHKNEEEQQHQRNEQKHVKY